LSAHGKPKEQPDASKRFNGFLRDDALNADPRRTAATNAMGPTELIVFGRRLD
jgi:hypothetical protein